MPAEIEVVITGLGVVCALGKTADDFAKSLAAAKDGIKPITLFDAGNYAFSKMGEVVEFDVPANQDRATALALSAAEQAIADAGESWVLNKADVTGVVMGTTCGGVSSHESILRKIRGNDKPGNSDYDEVLFQNLSCSIARKYEFGGPVSTITIACASGANAIGYGADLIRKEQADIVLAGGSDTVSNFTFSGFSSLRAMTTKACRPFSSDRDGLALGEGAAVVVLESLNSAMQRGAKIYGKLAGYGFHNDAYHSTAPSPVGSGLVQSINTAMRHAKLSHTDIDYVNAHGTATKANDVMECEAYKTIFGSRISQVPVSATKSMLGHTLGAAGAIEIAACLVAMRDGFIPPTINFTKADPKCLFDAVPNESRLAKLRNVLCCNAGFGGNNTAVLLSRIA